MSDVRKKIVIPALMMPLSELQPNEPVGNRPPTRIYEHAPGDYCFYCSCDDCKMFFGHGRRIQCVDPRTLEAALAPRYNYMCLVNSLRTAAAKREEARQDKLQAERDGTDGVKSPEKEKVSKTLNKKSLHQTIKRRRL